MGTQKWILPTSSREYNSWRAMRNRCLFDNKSKSSIYYRKKGITVCSEWENDFDMFFKDMGYRPEGTTLDRINTLEGYSKKNCRWLCIKGQQNNKSNNVIITHKGVSKTMSEWAIFLSLTARESSRARKRYQKYKSTSFKELFEVDNLTRYRNSIRVNKCYTCGANKSCKWLGYGTECSQCYQRRKRYKADYSKAIR